MARLVRPSAPAPYTTARPPAAAGGGRSEWKDTAKGSARTAASSDIESGTGMSMESWADIRSAQAPGASVMTPDVHPGSRARPW